MNDFFDGSDILFKDITYFFCKTTNIHMLPIVFCDSWEKSFRQRTQN